MGNYSGPSGFDVFRHPDDPILYNSRENRFYSKQYQHYAISNLISEKGGKFYVNHKQPCCFLLTGKEYYKYDQGTGRKEFFLAPHSGNIKLHTSEWHWACGVELSEKTYTSYSFLRKEHFFLHLDSVTHLKAAIWWDECADRISHGVKILSEHFWVITNNECSSAASRQYEPTLYLFHIFGTVMIHRLTVIMRNLTLTIFIIILTLSFLYAFFTAKGSI